MSKFKYDTAYVTMPLYPLDSGHVVHSMNDELWSSALSSLLLAVARDDRGLEWIHFGKPQVEFTDGELSNDGETIYSGPMVTVTVKGRYRDE